MCIKLYLDKCRTEHNIAFFEWRQNFDIDSKDMINKYSKKLQKSLEKEETMMEFDEKEGESIKLLLEEKYYGLIA